MQRDAPRAGEQSPERESMGNVPASGVDVELLPRRDGDHQTIDIAFVTLNVPPGGSEQNPGFGSR